MKVYFSNHQISFGTLVRMCGGELHQGDLGEVFVRAICTDSREVDSETAFIALAGERVDGHDYIPEALSKGCRCVICEHSSEAIQKSGATAIVVNDTGLAISRLANAYRQNLHAHTIGITGSVGKTTTKDMIASVLSVAHATYKTPGNHNSLVGMPLSMLEIPLDAAWSVLEMGMSHFGEVERLSITAEPDIAIITNIGTSHMEMLGSRENICRAKLEILSGLTSGGVLLLNGDEPLLRQVGGKSYRTLYVSVARENADFFAKNIKVESDRTTFDVVWNGGHAEDLEIRVLGRHNVYAALYAFAVGILSGMSVEEIRQGLSAFVPEGMRQKLFGFQNYTFIEDCYNAAPESMMAAIDVLDAYSRETNRRTVAVLGDMLELGTDSPSLHRLVGAHLAERGIDRLFVMGQGGMQIAVGARQNGMNKNAIVQTSDVEALEWVADELIKELKDGDVVLFKASRSVGAERIIEYLREKLA